jgi:uncharacterized membrane protein
LRNSFSSKTEFESKHCQVKLRRNKANPEETRKKTANMLRLSLFVVLLLIVVALAKPAPDFSAEDFFGGGSSEERFYPRRGYGGYGGYGIPYGGGYGNPYGGGYYGGGFFGKK